MIWFIAFYYLTINSSRYKDSLRIYREKDIFIDRALQYGFLSPNDNEDDEDTEEEHYTEWTLGRWYKDLEFTGKQVERDKKPYYVSIVVFIFVSLVLLFVVVKFGKLID